MFHKVEPISPLPFTNTIVIIIGRDRNGIATDFKLPMGIMVISNVYSLTVMCIIIPTFRYRGLVFVIHFRRSYGTIETRTARTPWGSIPPSTNKSRTLRNEFSRVFLSAVKKYGMEKPWMHRPTQLWKFFDGMLRNDDGKCLVGKG